MIDVLTLNYNDAETTLCFVEQMKKFKCVDHILVVDNKSTDGSYEKLKKIASEKIFVISSEKNGGYGAGNNLGILYLKKEFDSKYILLANPDVIVDEATLIKLQSFLASRQDYAIVAPVMKNPKGVIQYNTAFRIPSLMEFVLSLDLFLSKFVKSFYYSDICLTNDSVKDVDAVSGSLLMFNTDYMVSKGMYDEEFFLYCEELVLAKKMKRAKLKTGLILNLSFIHNHSVSISRTYKSAVSKRKLLMKSSLLVVKKYFKANFAIYFFASLISKISLLEVFFISLLKKK